MSDMSFADALKAAEEAGVGFKLVPIGEYEMYVYKAKAGKTSNGKHRIEATCKIVGGPQDGATVWNQFVLSLENANAMGFFFRHMAVLGAGVDWFSPRPINDATFAALADHILGSRFRAQVGVATVQGSERNQLDKIAASLLAPGQKMDGVSSGGTTPTPGYVGGVGPVPGGIAAPSTPQPQPQVATAPAPAPAPTPAPQPTPAQQEYPIGMVSEINGVQSVWTGAAWVPTGQAAQAEQPPTAPAASQDGPPKAPF